jgi:tungstate transport system substrate-binding protein
MKTGRFPCVEFRVVAWAAFFACLLWLLPMSGRAAEPAKLVLATTTSTADSGLLDFILPDFEQRYNADVEVVAVGTGQALKLGADCNADVVLVHARAQEDKFVADGYGVNRQDVMYNDFVLLGPDSDPAGVKGMTDAAAAFKKIAESGSKFISRGDNSGTHVEEQAIWHTAGIEPAGDWYVSSGQGMGEVLTMADELRAYTLSDRGTYLARTLEGTGLVIVVEGDPILFNPYGVIAVNPARCPNVKAKLADDFITWLISPETQNMIGEFKHPSGQPLFVPAVIEPQVTDNLTKSIGCDMIANN